MSYARFFRTLLLTSASVCLLAAPARAAEVEIRYAAAENGAGKLVAQGLSPAAYQAKTSATSVQFVFPAGTKVVVSQSLAAAGFKVASSQDGRSVTLSAKQIGGVRQAAIGDRLLLDMKMTPLDGVEAAKHSAENPVDPKPTEAAVKPAPASTPAPAHTPAPATEKPAEKVEHLAQVSPAAAASTPPKDMPKPAAQPPAPAPAPAHAAQPVAPAVKQTAAQVLAAASTVAPVHAAAPVPTPTPTQAPAPAPSPVPPAQAPAAQEQPVAQSPSVSLNISGTSPIAMAAFIRNGVLWIVSDEQDSAIAPVVEGSLAAAGVGELMSTNIPGGHAYRLRVPADAVVSVTGGGLIWKLTIGSTHEKHEGKPIRRTQGNNGTVVSLDMLASSIVRVPDPEAGDDLAVVLVNAASERQPDAFRLVDFDILPAVLGAVVLPKSDGIGVSAVQNNVEITRRAGLRIDPMIGADMQPARASEKTEDVLKPASKKMAVNTIFAFSAWGLGDSKNLKPAYQRLIKRLQQLNAEPQSATGALLDLAKFNVAHGLAYEANGYLELARANVSALEDSPEYRALAGIIHVLSARPYDALDDLSFGAFDTIPEIRIWRAAAMAQQGKLLDAATIIPPNLTVLNGYPPIVRAKIVPLLLDCAIARNDPDLGEALLDYLPEQAPEFARADAYEAMHLYYAGRMALLRGKHAQARHDLEIVSGNARGGAYTVRADLDLSNPAFFAKPASVPDIIAKLERARYGWRGDDYARQILERLGMLYLGSGEERKGLYTLKEANLFTTDDTQKKALRDSMQRAFVDLFRKTGKDKLSPLDAATIAIEFKDLIPEGPEGYAIFNRVIDDLVEIDLLDRAAQLIEQQITVSTDPEQTVRLAERVAGLRLIDHSADKALTDITTGLEKAAAIQNQAVKDTLTLHLNRLKVRALADSGKVDDALQFLATLPQGVDSYRLKADLAWKARRWADAADGFARLLAAAPPSEGKPLSQDNAQMILNLALAYNLAGDSGGLDQLAVAWGAKMAETPLAKPFQVLARIGGGVAITDKDALMKMVQEVDLFKDVLNGYAKSGNSGGAVRAK